MITDEQVKAALKEFYDHDGDRKFDVREYMRAALEAADAAAWRPISEAPKDGNHILVWRRKFLVMSAYWDANMQCWAHPVSRQTALIFEPTHFRPLPTPPKEPTNSTLDPLRAADAIEAVLAERDALKAELASGHMWIQMRATVFEELAMVRAERDALRAHLAPVDDKALVERDDFAEQIALRSENGISKDLQEFLRKFKEDDSAAIRMFAQYRDLEIEMDSWKSLWEKTNAHMRQVEAERDALAARLAPVCNIKLSQIGSEAIYKMKLEVAIDKETSEEPCGELGDPWSYIDESDAAIAAIRPHIEAAERERCVKAVETVGEKINVAHHERPEWEDGYLQGVHDAAAAIRSGK